MRAGPRALGLLGFINHAITSSRDTFAYRDKLLVLLKMAEIPA